MCFYNAFLNAVVILILFKPATKSLIQEFNTMISYNAREVNTNIFCFLKVVSNLEIIYILLKK